jgi:hypothetical protein
VSYDPFDDDGDLPDDVADALAALRPAFRVIAQSLAGVQRAQALDAATDEPDDETLTLDETDDLWRYDPGLPPDAISADFQRSVAAFLASPPVAALPLEVRHQLVALIRYGFRRGQVSVASGAQQDPFDGPAATLTPETGHALDTRSTPQGDTAMRYYANLHANQYHDTFDEADDALDASDADETFDDGDESFDDDGTGDSTLLTLADVLCRARHGLPFMDPAVTGPQRIDLMRDAAAMGTTSTPAPSLTPPSAGLSEAPDGQSRVLAEARRRAARGGFKFEEMSDAGRLKLLEIAAKRVGYGKE